MGNRIQDLTFKYNALNHLVGLYTNRAFRKFQIEGIENIPNDGCMLWASNHTNALMDPLVILRLPQKVKVFVARADIFHSKPYIVRILTFLKIMPIYRMRDGIDSVKRNDEIISRAADVLADGVPLTIFPEATHRAMHSLLRLSKGVFHIAFAVNEKMQGRKPVYIVPIGIEYGDYFRFRSTVLVRFGKPVDVSAFLRENPDMPQPVQMQRLRDILTQSLSELISYVPDDDDYAAIWEYAKLKAGNKEYFRKALTECENKAGRKLNGLEQLQSVDKYAISEALALKGNEPEKAAELFRNIDAQRLWRIKNGISVKSIAGNTTWGKTLLKMLTLLVGLPYYLFTAIVCAIVWIPTQIIIRKVDDDAFHNTARFGARILLSWIYVLAFGIIFFKTLPLLPAIILTVLLFPAFNYFTDYRESARRTLSDFRWLRKRKKAPRIQ